MLNRLIIVSSGATALARFIPIFLVLCLFGCGGSGSAHIVTPPPVASVTVTPSSATIPPGKTQQFTATAKDSGGNVVTGVSVTWMSDTPSVATVDTNGLATAVSQGTAHVTATASGVTGSATLTSAIAALSFSSPCVPVAGTIPCTFWGIHVNKLTSYPLQLPYGEFRGWDGATANWPDIQSCPAGTCTSPPPFVWTNLDAELSKQHQASVNDVMYTLSRTPKWASQNPNDSTCNYSKYGSQNYGECQPPVDLNGDGTGTNQIWRNWIAAIATHVNDPSYLQTHSHIKYWETWNEFNRITSWVGTYDQLVRLAQDARCIITGKVATIMATGESCSTVLGTVRLTQPADPNAVMVAPSTTGIHAVAIANFLYCNNNSCKTGSAGANAVDIINVHLYLDTQTPEQMVTVGLPKLIAVLQPAELQKPIWNGEGSWGLLSGGTAPNIWANDAYARAGMIARYFALLWSGNMNVNIKQIMWYGYDTPTGQLFNPTTGLLNQPEANAWISTYNWLSNAVPSANTPFCPLNGTVYHCDFTESNGLKASLVWDSQYGQNCSSMGAGIEPIICGNTPYPVNTSTFNKDWLDLAGGVHSVSSTVMIGANPILLEGQ